MFPKPSNDYPPKIFELKGRSLMAALELHARIQNDLLPALWSDVRAAQTRRDFKVQNKGLIDAIGLNDVFVKVAVIDGTAPRAYAHRTASFFHPGDRSRVYLYAPVDYRGDYFIPEDAELLPESEAQKIDIGLWACGHSQPAFVAVPLSGPRGIALPGDFNANDDRQNCRRESPPFDGRARYALVRSFENSKFGYFNAGAVDDVSWYDQFTFDVRIGVDDHGAPEVYIKPVAVADGRDLRLRDNGTFVAVPVADGYYRADPRPQTAGGMVMRDLIAAVPPLSPEKIWDIADERDYCSGIVPPPKPEKW